MYLVNPTFNLFILGVIFLLNINSFSLFYRDKKRAMQKKYRISESTLLLSAFFLGGIGALIGMYGLRHKTKHLKFQLLIPLAALLTTYNLYRIMY